MNVTADSAVAAQEEKVESKEDVNNDDENGSGNGEEKEKQKETEKEKVIALSRDRFYIASKDEFEFIQGFLQFVLNARLQLDIQSSDFLDQ